MSKRVTNRSCSLEATQRAKLRKIRRASRHLFDEDPAGTLVMPHSYSGNFSRFCSPLRIKKYITHFLSHSPSPLSSILCSNCTLPIWDKFPFNVNLHKSNPPPQKKWQLQMASEFKCNASIYNVVPFLHRSLKSVDVCVDGSLQSSKPFHLCHFGCTLSASMHTQGNG